MQWPKTAVFKTTGVSHMQQKHDDDVTINWKQWDIPK